jgi:hypothetical protein
VYFANLERRFFDPSIIDEASLILLAMFSTLFTVQKALPLMRDGGTAQI